jgi:hypothetical protein
MTKRSWIIRRPEIAAGAPHAQRADMLSPLEIRAAIKVAERENGAMSADDAVIASPALA